MRIDSFCRWRPESLAEIVEIWAGPQDGTVGYAWGFPQIRGTFLGVPYKDFSILGSTLGSPYFGKLLY